MKKIIINMFSKADKVEGQGVGSAYLEQVNLIIKGAPHLFDVHINKNVKADINHFHTIEPQSYLKMKKNKTVNVAYVHFLPDTLDGSIKLPKPIFYLFKKYVIKFYKKADYLVVVNPIFIKELVKLGISEEKIKYIPNYVSKDQFFKQDVRKTQKTRDKYNIDPKEFIVLGVGQVQIRKGVIDFVEVARNNPDITFVWCGGFSFGNITDGYKELKEVYENPPKNVKFLGIIPRTEMNDMFNMADVLWMPSYNELFPMAILEASNTETPILLRDLELYENILFDNYIKESSNDGFEKQLRKLKDDSKYHKKYSDASKKISEFYSKENVLQMWIDFYTEIYNKK